VVPNRFPALAGRLGLQEVVVHTPRHVCSLADLTPTELADVALAWQARAREARTAGFAYVHAFVNEGRAAGASRQHGHSQLAWLSDEPQSLARERANAAALGGCPLCVLLAQERASGTRVVVEEAGVAVLASYAARAPYELLVAPLSCEDDAFTSDQLSAALRVLAGAIRRLHAVEGRVPLNAWVHTFPQGGGHWHVELLPRITVFAGLELGAELYVNPLSPEEAARRLRG
jgi:UDPglucose--hexose-1-phosphate uridylyltransferase